MGLFAALVGIAAIWFSFFPTTYPDYRVEFVGLIFDVLFILVVLALFERRHQRHQDIKRQHEIIDDYKRWDREEARIRISGAIRRLNRLGVFALNLSGLALSNYDFSHHGIRSLKGSVFYDGTWGEPFSPASIRLTKVSFDWVNCERVQFSPYDPLAELAGMGSDFAVFTDCSFIRSNLKKASFAGARLLWTGAHPETHFSDEGDDDDDNPIRLQVTYGPFDEADLTDASFEGAYLTNVDFRGAANIEMASFLGASGLDSCLFDSENLKKAILRSSSPKAA